MFTKFKAWFTGMVAAEVAKLETSLNAERDAVRHGVFGVVIAAEKRLEASAEKLEARSQELLKEFEQKLIAEASVVVGEKNKLIAELHTKIADLEQTARKITHWKADSSTVEADHSLKVVK